MAANVRGDAHVFSGGEQDSFSFDLGQLEDKINNVEGMEWYCNFDTPQRDRKDVEEENDEIKKILNHVVVDDEAPPPLHIRPEILSFIEVQKDESVDFETREKMALELAR